MKFRIALTVLVVAADAADAEEIREDLRERLADHLAVEMVSTAAPVAAK